MRSAKGRLRDIGLLLGTLSLFALPIAAAHAQTAPSTGDIIEKLAVEAETNIDLAALKQQAADRIKARADTQPQKPQPIAPRRRVFANNKYKQPALVGNIA